MGGVKQERFARNSRLRVPFKLVESDGRVWLSTPGSAGEEWTTQQGDMASLDALLTRDLAYSHGGTFDIDKRRI